MCWAWVHRQRWCIIWVANRCYDLCCWSSLQEQWGQCWHGVARESMQQQVHWPVLKVLWKSRVTRNSHIWSWQQLSWCSEIQPIPALEWWLLHLWKRIWELGLASECRWRELHHAWQLEKCKCEQNQQWDSVHKLGVWEHMSQEAKKLLFWSDSTYKLEYVDAGKFYVKTDFCPDSTCTFI